MTDLTEMWAALESYQPYADKAGHGDTWRRMTTERTADAAKWAAEKAWAAAAVRGAAWAKVEDAAFVAARAARDAASATARAAAKLGSACRFAQRAIDTIKEVKP